MNVKVDTSCTKKKHDILNNILRLAYQPYIAIIMDISIINFKSVLYFIWKVVYFTIIDYNKYI